MAPVNRLKASKGKSSRPSSKKANAAGYLKRQSRKSSTLQGSTSDVYEYRSDPKIRRSKIKLDYDRDEDGGMDGVEDENEDMFAGGRQRAKLFGVDADAEMIGSEDDEEIDSDAAFEESDEERFAGFSFGPKKAKSKSKKSSRKEIAIRLPDIDLNEDEESGEDIGQMSEDDSASDEESEEEGDPSEFIDVLDVLDGRGEPEMDDNSDVVKPTSKGTSSVVGDSDDEDSEQNEEDDNVSDEGSEEADLMESDVEDDSPEALAGLEDFISNLPVDVSRKRKAENDDPSTNDSNKERKNKRRLLKETTAAGVEGEFRAQNLGPKVNLNDLLAPISSESSNLASLQKSVKALTGKASSANALSAPLPQRAQERLDREAAYEQTKEEVDKWSATMRRIREAEHLSFPLQAEPEGKTSNLELAAKFKPTTSLETAVDNLLKSASLKDQADIALSEERSLQAQNLTLEQVAERRAELRKMRELMFRAETKAKRVAKIKSKTYRKIQKKRKAKLDGDEEEDEDEDEEARMKKEIARARERATLKHRSTGKWATEMKRKGEMDEDSRREMEEMLSRGEKLRRKIQGVGSDDESEDESDDEAMDIAGEDGVNRIRQIAFDEIARLNSGEASAQANHGGGKKSVFEMKFMKDAMAKQQLEADQLASDFMKEMSGADNAIYSDGAEEDSRRPENVGDIAVSRVGGRVAYRPNAINTNASLRPTGSLASDTSSVTLKSTDILTPQRTTPIETGSISGSVDAPSNPWLARASDDSSAAKLARKKNEVVVSKDSKAAEKSKNKLGKKASRREAEKEKRAEDAVVEVSMDKVLTMSSGSKSNGKQAQGKGKEVEVENDDDEGSEYEEQERILQAKQQGKNGRTKAFEQRDLVAQAFAGDNVVQEFESMKQKEIEEDAPHEVDTTLAGWGSWGGAGTKKLPSKPHLIKKIAGINPSTRADFKKSHVVISEKKDKKAAKYQVNSLPFPYTSRAQYERSIERPVGSEWNTRVGFQRATMPKVVTKKGVIIDPLEKRL